MNNKNALLWIGLAVVVVLIVAGGLYLASAGPSAPSSPVATGSLNIPVSAADNSRGPASAKVVLVEYSDFQCPACAAYYSVLEQVLKDFPNDVRLVYRHFPLPYHQQAMPAALAAEAAGKQGKFWEMYQLIFDHQTDWAGKKTAQATFTSYAEQLGLNLAQFQADLTDSALIKKINSQKDGGVAAGVDATPTFYLNGQKIDNPRSYDSFSQLIKAELNR